MVLPEVLADGDERFGERGRGRIDGLDDTLHLLGSGLGGFDAVAVQLSDFVGGKGLAVDAEIVEGSLEAFASV